MTTIAYRRGVLAADSQITSGDLRAGRARKIGRHLDVLAAWAGKVHDGQPFLRWVEGGMEGEPPEMEHATGALFFPKEEVVLFHSGGSESRYVDTFGMGTGGEIAQGAMLAGATPFEAVKAAIKLDIYSGGPVRTLTRD